MVFFGSLRSCSKHPCGRLLMLVFLLSLVAMVMIPQMVSKNVMVKIMSVAYQENRPENDTMFKRSADVGQINDNNNRSLITPESPPSQVTGLTVVTTIKNQTTNRKFLIYICDHKTYCYGLGDRQRGLVSVYLLAEVTNRSFGIIMTSPSEFTEFYQPNLVPWDIPKSELEGRSSVEILAYGPRVQIGLHEIDFNKVYPQDVVYVRTNHKWQMDLMKNHHYRDKFPEWAKGPAWKMFQVAWLRLMTPTKLLRQELNSILIGIVQDMKDESDVWRHLNNTKCCETKYINASNCNSKPCDATELQNLCCNLTESNISTHVIKTCDDAICANKSNVMNCESVTCPAANITQCNNKTCTDLTENEKSRSLKTNDCIRCIGNMTTNVTELSRLKTFARNYCDEKRPVLEPWMSVESIQKTQGFDKVNINLVCVHIRIGHSSTLPKEGNVRNKPETVKAVWNFLKPYVATGQHVYLATDSQAVRQEAKDIFGSRLHVSSVPIQHIALVRKVNERSAFSLTLVEQLLLATSCKVLVISYSGFSMKAAQIRDQLPGGAWELYIFKDGVVQGKSVKWLLR
ncbi:hypothetical protein BsWGS_06496 [Bradybaena similaris]